MTPKELAERLNGRQYGEISPLDAELARKNGLVIVYGASDDLMEFTGAINGEMEVYEGGTVRITSNGILKVPCEDMGAYCIEECEHYKKIWDSALKITAVWGERRPNIPWTYQTDIPHETFDIMSEEEVYCRGIVFALADLDKKPGQPFKLTEELIKEIEDKVNNTLSYIDNGVKESLSHLENPSFTVCWLIVDVNSGNVNVIDPIFTEDEEEDEEDNEWEW
jgi:hypothetical protein